jgi:hypothetical protein
MSSPESVAVVSVAGRAGISFSSADEAGWRVRYGREFNMSDDSHRFPAKAHFENAGFVRGSLGLYWRDQEVALPLLEGRCIDAFHCFASRWVSGRGRTAKWAEQDVSEIDAGAQFYIAPSEFLNTTQFRRGFKIAVMDVTGVTNTRSVIAACVPSLPSGNSLNIASTRLGDASSTAALCGALNSFVFDHMVRLRLTGQHVTEFFLRDVPLPKPSAQWVDWLGHAVMRLNGIHPLFADWWMDEREC